MVSFNNSNTIHTAYHVLPQPERWSRGTVSPASSLGWLDSLISDNVSWGHCVELGWALRAASGSMLGSMFIV